MIGKKHFLFLVLCSLAVAFSFQGSRGLFESTEGRYAEAAREMVQSQNWLIPTLNYHPHLTKPPMTYWLMGLGMKLLGQNEWGLRLYGACAYVGLVFAIFEISRTLWDIRTAFLSGLVAVSSPFLMASQYTISTDIVLTLWLTLSMLCYCKIVFKNSRHQRIWVNLFWFFLGLAFFTKGTPALLNLAIVLLFHFYLRLTKRPAANLWSMTGIVIFLTTGFWWYIYLTIRNPAILNYFLKDEVVNRILSDKFDRNPQWYYPLIVYLPLMGSVFIPFGLMLTPSLRFFVSDVFCSLRNCPKWLKERPKAVFLLIWIIVPLLIFSFSLSRLPFYILPCFVPCIVMVGRMVSTVAVTNLLPQAIRITLITVIFLISAKGYLAYSSNKKNARQIYECLPSAPAASYYLFNNPKFFGLQFYLNGNLKRIGLVADERFDITFGQFVQTLRENVSKDPIFLIIEGHKIPDVRAELDAFHIAYTIQPARYDYFCICFF